VEHGVVAPVDLIPPVHVGADQVAIAGAGAEDGGLVRAGVCAQQRVAVDVEGLGVCAARMVGWEAERVEILVRRHHRVEVVVGNVLWRGELGLENLPCDGYWVVFLEVDFAIGGCKDVLGNIVPFIGRICFAIDCYRLWRWYFLFPRGKGSFCLRSGGGGGYGGDA
jgi:hypothetical protein